MNALLGEISYTATGKTNIAKLMIELGLVKSDTGPFVILRRNRGSLLKRPKTDGIEITAEGRADWVGSLELRDEPVNEQAMRNTARVMIDIKADGAGRRRGREPAGICCIQRGDYSRHRRRSVSPCHGHRGNDERGIDVGLMTRDDCPSG